jgi:hypothetical protein
VFSKDIIHEPKIVILMNLSDDIAFPILEKYFYEK